MQILLQGGHNPYIPFEWYLELMRYIKKNHRIHIHGFSPSEVVFFSERFRIPVPDVIRQLRRPASTAFPAAAARSSSTHPSACCREEGADRGMARRAGRGPHQGMKTSVTMMYGLGETDEDRVEHLLRVRELQARTGGFTAFICWPLQPEGTPEMSHMQKTDAVTYLRTLALSRIVLTNVPNLQSSWVTMGHKVGQVALRYGANDYGSLMMEENVVSAAGTTFRTTVGEIERNITDAGFEPRRRRQDYSLIESQQTVAA